MRQMIFEGPGRARWHEMRAPTLAAGVSALVEPVAVATCDLDVGFMRGQAAYFGSGFPLGHESVARIVAIGDDVHDRAVGDLVVVPFQISCGSCRWCTQGLTAHCDALPGLPAYGMGERTGGYPGMLADRFIVPYADHMLVPVPIGLEPTAVASASDNLPDAYRAASEGLRHAPRSDVLIVGGRAASIGLYAIGFANALGASSVTYTDRDQSRLRLAEQVGARIVERIDDHPVDRFQVTIDASGSRAGLESALRSTDHEGICIVAAMPFRAAPLPLLEMYLDSLTVRIGRNSARAFIPAALEVIARGDMDPRPVTNQTVAWDDAEAALTDPPDKLVILGPNYRSQPVPSL